MMQQLIAKFHTPKCQRCGKEILVGSPIESIYIIQGSKKIWVHVGCKKSENGMDQNDYRAKSSYTAPSRNSSDVDNKTLAYAALGKNWDWSKIDFIESIYALWIWDRTDPIPDKHLEKDIVVYHMFNRAINRHMYVDKSGILYEVDWNYMGRTDGQIFTLVECGVEEFQPVGGY